MLTNDETIPMPNWPTIPAVVRAYFLKYPEAGKYSRQESHLNSSYLYDKNSKKIYPIAGKLVAGRRIAKGRFGVVKQSQFGYVIKRQIIHDEKELERARSEAEFTMQLGIAESGLIECSFKKTGYPYKVYQVMKYAGVSLHKKISSEAKTKLPSPEVTRSGKAKELKRAIRVCFEVMRIHALGIAHRDIKLANLVENSIGQIHLIDFGFATMELDVLNAELLCVGTPEYMLIDAEYATSFQSRHITGLFKISQDPLMGRYLTCRFSDKIALLRSILHPSSLPSILSQKLPSALYKLLDTTYIKPHMDIKRCAESPDFFAAVLISYLNNGFNILEDEIQNLRQNTTLVDAVIQAYCTKEEIDVFENILTITEEDLSHIASADASVSRPWAGSSAVLDTLNASQSPLLPSRESPVGRRVHMFPLSVRCSPVVRQPKMSVFPDGAGGVDSKRPFTMFRSQSNLQLPSPIDEDDKQVHCPSHGTL